MWDGRWIQRDGARRMMVLLRVRLIALARMTFPLFRRVSKKVDGSARLTYHRSKRGCLCHCPPVPFLPKARRCLVKWARFLLGELIVRYEVLRLNFATSAIARPYYHHLRKGTGGRSSMGRRNSMFLPTKNLGPPRKTWRGEFAIWKTPLRPKTRRMGDSKRTRFTPWGFRNSLRCIGNGVFGLNMEDSIRKQ